MSYVDGYLIPVKKTKINAYKKMAKLGCKIWMEHGALQYFECVGANLKSPWGTPFAKVYKLKANETLIFAFIIYKNKAHRNKVVKKVYADPRMQAQNGEMPFDMKRFSVGEFKAVVEA
ncbi:MAG: RNA signal recognition particle 4.5S RNA [Bdellovibrio sp. ArHS]|uniref:DUF1428 domain-containing protein n=1 Tax=Bdellovibrio sp. ArHS TaxID=1569284 RepID=UPI0005832BD8|nr:DUF1428 domain-containing protein [Bdellovibrio sp. ArHS]KHD89608.1 MAG: RNA signal recognition particle 4.5S RNA [Bdellovibrio sp. ArHS]